MYTKRELKRAAEIIRQIARGHQVTEEEVRRDMKEAMDVGRSNPDPAVQAKWADFEYAGDEPTLEEFILWMARSRRVVIEAYRGLFLPCFSSVIRI